MRTYHAAMVERGARDLDWDACWEGYRRQSFHGVLMSIAASMLVVRTERGDDMFMTTLARYAQQAIDLDAVGLLPEAGAGRPAPLAPSPGDEQRHEPAGEQLWNESYYFDAVSADGTVGAYVRIGLYPNLGVAWYTTFVCGPDRADGRGRRPRSATPRRRLSRHRPRGPACRPRVRGAAAALSRHARCDRRGARRRLGVPARRAGHAERRLARSRVGDRRDPVRLPPDHPLRDPLHGPRHDLGSTARRSSSPAPDSATTRGALATGGRWTGCGAPARSTTAPAFMESRCGSRMRPC